jgi:N-formylglutamate amidohydrolase
MVAPLRALARDADLYVDELYRDAPDTGATLLVAHTSRYLLDLNRSEDDLDATAVAGAASLPSRPRGLGGSRTTDNQRAHARPLTREELVERLDTVHRPYHATLARLLERKRARFGYVVLLAAHSMPSVGRSGHGDSGTPRADVVPGTQGRTTARGELIDRVERHAKAGGFVVRHDDPYRGGFTTRNYGRPAVHVHAVQVELARRLYMDERTLRRTSDFDRMRAWCRALVTELGKPV